MDKSKHWHDSRIVYPYKDIKITNELYIINTTLCKNEELWTLLYHRNRIKIKDSYDMMTYLLAFRPHASEMIKKNTGKSIYMPSLENFIMSTHPVNKIFDEDKTLIEKIAVDMLNHIKETQINCKEMLKQAQYILRNK